MNSEFKSFTASSPTLSETINKLIGNFSTIPDERKKLLAPLTSFVQNKLIHDKKIELVFICTHNSRRSHLSQIWAQVAAAYYGIPNVACYSGGTEATAFNPRAVKAMRDAGFQITAKSQHENPVYSITFSEAFSAVEAFSKKYDSPPNPTQNFAAIMTCTHADENCPVVSGMEKRISLPYNDPKDFDGTSLEEQKYAERVMEIGTEIFYAFSLVTTKL